MKHVHLVRNVRDALADIGMGPHVAILAAFIVVVTDIVTLMVIVLEDVGTDGLAGDVKDRATVEVELATYLGNAQAALTDTMVMVHLVNPVDVEEMVIANSTAHASVRKIVPLVQTVNVLRVRVHFTIKKAIACTSVNVEAITHAEIQVFVIPAQQTSQHVPAVKDSNVLVVTQDGTERLVK